MVVILLFGIFKDILHVCAFCLSKNLTRKRVVLPQSEKLNSDLIKDAIFLGQRCI